MLATGAAFAFWAEGTRWGRRLSAPMWAILFGVALSNTHVVPTSAPAFQTVSGLLVPAAIPLLLLKANLRRVFAESGRLLLAFMIGVLGTVLGVFLAYWLVPLDEAGPQLAGVYTGTYTGGSMNFVAVSQALGFEASSLYAGAIATDNIVSTVFLLVLIGMPALGTLRRWLPSEVMDQRVRAESEAHRVDGGVLLLLHLSIALAISLVLCALGQWLASVAGVPDYAILFITALAVLVANVFPAQLGRLEGDFALGMLFMNLFFVTVGVAAYLPAMLADALRLVPFAVIIVAVHLAVVLVGARLARIDLAEALTASNACVLGPTTAAAVAAASGWRSLVTPAVLVGVLGYAIANFLGVAVAGWLA